MTGYVADLSWKSGARAIEKLDRLRSTMAVNVLKARILSFSVRFWKLAPEFRTHLSNLDGKHRPTTFPW